MDTATIVDCDDPFYQDYTLSLVAFNEKDLGVNSLLQDDLNKTYLGYYNDLSSSCRRDSLGEELCEMHKVG